ncbi:hypothetical protein PENTCL1PPCAC_11082, partial [Pristionchus entomophagus]
NFSERHSLFLFSRHFVVCFTATSNQRTVYTHCEHIVFYQCALNITRMTNGNRFDERALRRALEREEAMLLKNMDNRNDGKCVFCRSSGDFIKLAEKECGIEKNNNSSLQKSS